MIGASEFQIPIHVAVGFALSNGLATASVVRALYVPALRRVIDHG